MKFQDDISMPHTPTHKPKPICPPLFQSWGHKKNASERSEFFFFRTVRTVQISTTAMRIASLLQITSPEMTYFLATVVKINSAVFPARISALFTFNLGEIVSFS